MALITKTMIGGDKSWEILLSGRYSYPNFIRLISNRDNRIRISVGTTLSLTECHTILQGM